MVDWTEKYRPTTLDDVRGNDKAVDALREWAKSWDSHRKAVILHGPPGIGKTSAAHALAREMGWESIELNASDQRKAADIERYAGRGAKNRTIEGAMRAAERTLRSEHNGGPEGNGGGEEGPGDATEEAPGDAPEDTPEDAPEDTPEDAPEDAPGDAPDDGDDGPEGRQLIIIDEADNFHGNADRGGAAAIADIVREAGQPIVLVANDFYDMSRGLRNACETVEFSMQKRSVIPALRHICREEGIEFEEEALERIAEGNSTDLRGAVNDLQAVAEGREKLALEDVVTGDRDREQGIFDFLDELIKEADAREALEASYEVDESPDDLVAWIEDNVPKDYHGAELARAYRALADADRWLGRVRQTQNYRFWRYASDAMTAGVAAARGESKGGWTRYGPPSYWSKLGRSRGSRQTRDHVARKIAEAGGVSMGTARRRILPFLSVMTHHCKNRELTVRMAARYDLEEEHVAFVTGSGEDTNKVQDIVADARELLEAAAVEHSGGAFGGGGPEDTGDGGHTEETGTPADAGDADGTDTPEDADRAEGDEEEEAEEAIGNDQQSGLGDYL